jgi:hypothetical protein
MVEFLLRGEQVEQQRAQASVGQDAGDVTVARAVPAAAAAVREDHDPCCVLWHRQVAGQPDLPRGGLHLLTLGGGQVP